MSVISVSPAQQEQQNRHWRHWMLSPHSSPHWGDGESIPGKGRSGLWIPSGSARGWTRETPWRSPAAANEGPGDPPSSCRRTPGRPAPAGPPCTAPWLASGRRTRFCKRRSEFRSAKGYSISYSRQNILMCENFVNHSNSPVSALVWALQSEGGNGDIPFID